jgi:hypothetical protein
VDRCRRIRSLIVVYAVLGDEIIYFVCDKEQAGQQLGLLFHGWPKQFEKSSPSDYLSASSRPLSLILQTSDALEPAPVRSRPIFADQNSQIMVFQDDHFWFVCFGSAAVARVPAEPDIENDTPITVQVTHKALYAGRLEDIIFSSLAPALRRRGLFMIHAFAVENDDGAVLLVGESGSGKTTTGLSLLSQGWRYLANDVVLLQERSGSVFALPTPGGIGLDGHSFALLPGLDLPAGASGADAKHYFPATELVTGWGAGAPVSRILFTEIGTEDETELRPATHSLTLARMMEASIDRWDTASLKDHLHILELLSRQAMGFEVSLGRELRRLTGLLNQS